MRVAVAGAGGFLGRHLTTTLRDRGDEVVAFVRPGGAAPDGPRVRWDPSRHVLDDGDLDRAGPLDAVVNLAGVGIAEHRWTPARRAQVLSSRVNATRLLVEATGSAGPDAPFLASASAIGYYGPRGDDVVDESSSRGTGFLADVCAQWETAATKDPRRSVAVLRTGIVLGADGGALARQLPLFRWGLGGMLGDGRQWMSPISLVDVIGSILWVIDRRVTGAVNLTMPTPVTNRDFTRSLARAVGRPAVLRVPRAALAAVLGGDLAREVVLASQRVIPGVLSDSGYPFRHLDVDSALAAALAARR